ncbi:hypothetical protein EMPS_10106 [Entomortierella parvispora]|uniref:BHLH domain-containing protein n=1 Tax=Entomortierella parvispora TaxID=205924 RepID=A0A9P3HK60_9FUNG|nr:hypothetical protein EMPS_10106 [Entomortierella parvispora]
MSNSSSSFDHGSSRPPLPHHHRPQQPHRASSGHISYSESSSLSTLRLSPPQPPFAHHSGDVNHNHPDDTPTQQRSPTASEYHYQYPQQHHHQQHQHQHHQPLEHHQRQHYPHASEAPSSYGHRRSHSYHQYQQQPQEGHSSSSTSPLAHPSHSHPSPNSSFYPPPLSQQHQQQQQQQIYHPQQQHPHSTLYPFEHPHETLGPSSLRDHSRRRSVKEEESQESFLASVQQYTGAGDRRRERIRQHSSSSSTSTHRLHSNHSSPDSPPRSPPLPPLQPLTINIHGLNNVTISSASSSSAIQTTALTTGSSASTTTTTASTTPQPESTTTRSPQTPPRTPSPRKYSEHVAGEPDNDMKLQLSRSSTGGSAGGRRGGPLLNHSHRAGHKISTREAASSSSTTPTGAIPGIGVGGLSTAARGGGGGGGSNGGGPGAAPVGPNRRLAHILSEQKRREKINGGFDELKSVIPECAQNTDSKATILRKAVDYILQLEDEIRRYADAYPPPPLLPPSSHSMYPHHRGSAGARGQAPFDDSDS